MRIELFSEEYKTVWNDFVATSKNGTFLFNRNFMDYHADRFKDHSLLFYKQDKLIALLPGNVEGDTYYSHQGLTYGGLITSADIRSKDVLNVFDVLIAYLRKQNISEIIYKAIPHIYHSMPAEEDLYALFRHRAEIVGRNISSTIDLNKEKEFSSLRRRGLQRALKAKLRVEKDDNFADFWKILSENLKKRYNTTPVHTLSEIKLLYSKFPDNIKQYSVYSSDNKIIAGIVSFCTQTVIHLQYIAANEEGKESGALDLVVDYILKNETEGKSYFDFGTSTEKNGLFLNEGLIHQKEGFGGRGVVYDIYRIKLK